ncbi:hypothetical protein JL722_9415 [Aureococcus anophagefferens]|nr:hypothetical protein JL722_9415 [Aureococcus anophagefferens]
MAAPRFRLRTGAPDWAKITAVDVDDVLETGSAGDVLSDLVDDLAFCKVVPPELRKVGHDASATMVRLLQLAVEYLLHVQEALGDEVVAKESALRELAEDATRAAAGLGREAQGARAPGRRVMGAYGAARGRAWACAQCGKAFVNREYLEQHIRRKHGGSLAASGDAGLVAIARCFEAVARGPRPEASRRELLDCLQRGGHLEAIFGAARSEAERAVAEGTVAALLGDASADACVGPRTSATLSPSCGAAGASPWGAALRRRRPPPAAPAPGVLLGEDVAEVHVACVRAAGLPAIAEAGCVVALSRAGQRVAETPPAVGSREPTWLTSSHGATVAVPLAADEQRRERGLFVEVFAGSCLNVEVFGLGAAPPGAPFLEARWRGGAGSAPSVVWRSAAAVRASRRPDSFDLVAEHPLPLGLPFARRHAVLDVFALFVDDDGTEASCGDAVAVDAAGLRSRAFAARGEPVEFAAGSATRGLRAVASCSPLAAELGEAHLLAPPPRMFASLAVLGDPAARSEPTATGECALDVDLLVPRDAAPGAYVDVAVVDAASGLVGAASLDRADLATPSKRTTLALRDARGAVAGELAVCVTASPDVAAPPDRSDLARCRVADAQLSGFELDGALLEGDALEVEAELDGVVVGSRRSRGPATPPAPETCASSSPSRPTAPGAWPCASTTARGGACWPARCPSPARRGARTDAAAPRSLALALAPPPPDEAALVAAPPLAATLKFAVRLARRVRVRVCEARVAPGAASYAVSVSVGGNALGSTAPAFPVSSPAGGGRASVAWYDRFDLAVPWGADGEGGAVSLELVRVAGDGTRTSVGAAALAGSAAALAAAPGVGEATLGDARVEYHVAVTSFADAADLAVADRRALDAAIDGLEARPNLAHRVVGALDLLRDAAEDPPALVA